MCRSAGDGLYDPPLFRIGLRMTTISRVGWTCFGDKSLFFCVQTDDDGDGDDENDDDDDADGKEMKG